MPQGSTTIRLRPEDFKAVRRLASTYRLSMTECVSVLLQAWSGLSAEQQIAAVRRPESQARHPRTSVAA